MASSFEIGTTEGGMADITTTVKGKYGRVYIPRASYQEYSLALQGADSLVYGHGWPQAAWTWAVVPLTVRNTLRSTYCSGTKSKEVFIKTPVYEVYTEYRANMIWPEVELISNSFVIDFTLIFRLLEAL